MKEYRISSQDEGRRMDKYVHHILSEAPVSFVYKMIRKKNIVLNDKKALGNEILHEGDNIKFYLSDETFEKFTKNASSCDIVHDIPPIVYEDEDIIIVNKPAGMLSQKSSADSVSLNEILLSYVNNSKSDDGMISTFTPAVCNRLDRNTSGLVTFAKTYKGSRCLCTAFADHRIKKYYNCIVKGVIHKEMDLAGSLTKSVKINKVRVYNDTGAGKYINTRVYPISSNNELSLLEILLVTGKTHQIRAHLASVGHPLIGDYKYGDKRLNDEYKRRYGINHQMLVCRKMEFADDFEIKSVSGREFEIELPHEFSEVI